MTGGPSQAETAPEVDGFAQPAAAFRPAAYWFWHSLPSPDEMRIQLADFAEQGYGTILIQTRLAFPRSLYMSPAFLQCYVQAVSLMTELGLVAGLYDDYNWSSGQAGGRTVEAADHLRERHLFWATVDSRTGSVSGITAPIIAAMGPDIADWLYEGGDAHFGDWEVVAAALHPVGLKSPSDIRDVTSLVRISAVGNGCEFFLDGDVGESHRLTVFLSAMCLTSRLPNYLLPEAGERFVEVGLEPYAKAFGGVLPETLQFLFFDQPAPGFYTWNEIEGNLGNSLLWSEELFQMAEIACGIPIATVLLALLRDVGAETGILRTGFYKTYTTLIYQSFFAPLRRFCDRYGLRLTGHEILPHVGGFDLNGGFSSIDPRVAPAVDFFGLDALRDETAVDANNFHSQLSPKLGDSVARSNGRSRTLVEIYATALRTERRGAGQWELTPSTLRSQSIRLHMAGARQVLMHGLYQSDGYDDDSRLFSNPRFDFAPGLNFEPWWSHHGAIASETARLSAFLEDFVPATEVAVFYPLQTAWGEGPRHEHARHFGAWCGGLSSLSCGYMIVDAQSLRAARCGEGRFEANGLSFSALVLPALSNLELKVMDETIRLLKAAGVRVWISCVSPPQDFTVPNQCISGIPSQEVIRRLVRELPAPEFAVRSDGLASVAGTDAGGWTRIVLFNDGSSIGDARITSAPGFEFELWKADNGQRTPVACASSLDIALEPEEFFCLRVRNAASGSFQPVSIPYASPQPYRLDILADDWRFQLSEGDSPEPIDVDRGWQAQGFPAFSGTGYYTRRIDIREAANVVLDLPGVSVAARAYLDGRYVGACHHAPFRFELWMVPVGVHQLMLEVSNTAANRYYADTPYAGSIWPDESGLTQPPRLLFLPDNVE
jgi:hypothetical protein